MSIKTIFVWLLALSAMPSTGQEITSTNCNDSVCKYQLNIEEPGFYVFNNTLAQEATPGLWDFSIESKDAQLQQSKLYFGAKITATERKSTFISFYLNESSSIQLKATDHLNSNDQMKVRIYRRLDANDSKGLINFGSAQTYLTELTFAANELVDFPVLPKGHYIVTIFSVDEVGAGKLGVTMTGLTLANKVTVGGELSRSIDDDFDGYLAKSLDQGQYLIKTRFGKAKDVTYCGFELSCLGASKTTVLVKKSSSGGVRNLITSSETVSKLIDAETANDYLVDHVATSDDGNVIAYSLYEETSNRVKVAVYDRQTDDLKIIFDYNYINENTRSEIVDLSLSGNGSKVAYSFFSVRNNDMIFEITSNVKLYDRETATLSTVFSYGCGSNCSLGAPTENVSFDYSGRYLLIDPQEDYVQIFDSEENSVDYIQDLDFSIVKQMILSADASFLVFSSDNNELVGADNNALRDVFFKDLATGEIELISVLENGQIIQGLNHNPVMGTQQNLILFSSNDGPVISLYLYDRTKGYAEKLTDIGDHSQYSIDSMGNQVVFSSLLDLTVPKIGDELRLWSFDIAKQQLVLKVSSENKSINKPLLSADGQLMVFKVEENIANTADDAFNQIYLLDKQPTQNRLTLQ